MTITTILSVLTSTLLLISTTTAAAASAGPSELVRSVCNQTTNSTFCVTALSADPRARTADSYGLAFVAFGLAYVNASVTRDVVTELIRKASESRQAKRLERCGGDYGKAVAALEMAYSDLNSETFFELADLAGEASRHAGDCQAAFKDAADRPLTARNAALKGLCEICVAVSKLFTGGF